MLGKQTLQDNRYDFRGGRNSTVSKDLLNSNELVDATNARVSSVYGAISKRLGSQRMHLTAFPAKVNGVVQWDVAGSKQTVVISNGDLYYRNGHSYAVAFTLVAPAAPDKFSTTEPSFLVPFRAATAGAPLVLYIASAGKLYTFDGAGALTRIDGVAGAPTADRLIAYHTRLFARQSNLKKHVFFSKVGDGSTYTVGSKVDGGSALVDVLSGEELTTFEVIGSSLLMAGEDCIMRFTGHSSDDIVIAQDTEGVSSEVGAVGSLCLRRFENIAAVLSDRGPYAVNETQVVPIGEVVRLDFNMLDKTVASSYVVGWNRGTAEVLFAVSGSSDSSLNKTIYAYSARLQSWYGPWTYPFGITYMARYEDSNGVEAIVAGCNDGFLRHLNPSAILDDVLYDGSGGSAVTMTVEFPTITFGKPGYIKALKQMHIQARLPTTSALQLKHSFDGAAFVTENIVGQGAVEGSYRIDLSNQGYRLRMQLVDSTTAQLEINGFHLEAYDYNRP